MAVSGAHGIQLEAHPTGYLWDRCVGTESDNDCNGLWK